MCLFVFTRYKLMMKMWSEDFSLRPLFSEVAESLTALRAPSYGEVDVTYPQCWQYFVEFLEPEAASQDAALTDHTYENIPQQG